MRHPPHNLGEPTPARPRSGRGASRWRTYIGPVVLVTALASCGGLPNTSPVEQGLEVNARILPPLRFQLDPPPPGATREAIVHRFLLAGSQLQDDARAAQVFMTERAFESWNPRRKVTVFASPERLSVTPQGTSSVVVSGVAVAEIDADGHYRELPSGTTRRSQIDLTRESGEWRIAKLDPNFGLWIQQFYFDLVYRPFQIAYVSTSGAMIVSDHRWFPFGAAVGTTLARAQLESPPDYLAGTVVSGFPSGTRLGVDSVRLEDQTAVVELTARALDASASDRRAMWAQMLTTLTQVPRVAGVALRSDGRRLELAGLPQQPSSLADLGFSHGTVRSVAVVVLRQGKSLLLLDRAELTSAGDQMRPRDTSGAPLPRLDQGWVDLAAAGDAQVLAAISQDRTQLKTWYLQPPGGSSASTVATLGSKLTRPSFDSTGIWVAGQDDAGAGRVWFFPRGERVDRKQRLIEAPWLVERTVVALRMSPDGNRALVVSNGAGGLQIGLSGVQRGSDNQPLGLRPPLSLAGSIVEATDAAWVDDESAAVIGRKTTKEQLRPLLVNFSGPSEPLPPVAVPVAIRCLGGQRGLLVRTEDGKLRQLSGRGWRVVASVDDVAVPGS